MKRIIGPAVIGFFVSNVSHGMDPNAHLYDEAYATQQNSGKIFQNGPNQQANHDEMRNNNSQIAKQNHSIIKRGGYKTTTGINVTKDDLRMDWAKEHSKKHKITDLDAAVNKGKKGTVSIKEQDTFEAAIEIINKGGKVAILNFANKDTVGGGYLHGANAQEEDLCRRSTLYPILMNHKTKGEYPIAHDELIYSRGVKIIRSSNKDEFKFIEKPINVDVITQAAYNLNPEHKGGCEKVSDSDFKANTINKIRAQLRVAAMNNCGSIVVGAFGCGAFKNKPEVVSELYFEVLQEDEFKNVFNEVRFAILGQFNLNPFKETLKALPGFQVL